MSLRMDISKPEIKILFAKSGNKCAFPGCPIQLIESVADKDAPLGEMAHLIASEDFGPRADPSYPVEKRNEAQNLILLCPTHHAYIDKYPFQYSVDVLREMKRIHEGSVAIALGNHPIEPPRQNGERLYLSALPISGLPSYVFSAPTVFRKDNVLDLFNVVDATNHRDVIYAFELHDKRIYTFYDLNSPENPLRGAYGPGGVQIENREEVISSPDGKRLYIALVNRAFRSLLKKMGLGFDGSHNHFYFEPDRTTIQRRFIYGSLAGKKTTRSLVWHPVTKATDVAKPYWIHLAANLSFQQVARLEWALTIRPSRYLTTDGREPYSSKYVGRKITRMKSTVYNWQYLQELQLWREFICSASPRLIIQFGKQSLVIENRLPSPEVIWPGVPSDTLDFAAQTHEEDLFTSAEVTSLLIETEEFEADIDDHLFIYPEDAPNDQQGS